MAIDKVPGAGMTPWPRGALSTARPAAGQAVDAVRPTAAVRAAEIDPLRAPPPRAEGSPVPMPAMLHGVSARGMPVSIDALVGGGEGLARGDVLMVQVQATAPRLELGLFDVIARPAGARPPSFGPLPPPLQEFALSAMRPDQLVLRQLSWRLPDPAALATQWRLLVLAAAAQPGPPPHGVNPAAAPLAEPPVGGSPRDGMSSSFMPAPDRWLYPAYAWGGLHAMLRVLEPEGDAPPPRRRARALALRLEVDVPGIGRLAVLVQLLSDGVDLLMFVEDAGALPVVRGVLPALSSAFSLAGLTLARCRLLHGEPAAARPPVLMNQATPTPAAARLSPLLFRAAAEVVVVLSATLAPRGPLPAFG